MTEFLDTVATIRRYADAVGLALLPFGFGLAAWLGWRARQRDRRRRGIW